MPSSKPALNEVWWKEFLASLKNEFERRKRVNSRYSVRQYAAATGIANGAMSELMNGKRTLSAVATLKLLPKLKLSEVETRKLLALLRQPAEKKYIIPSREDAMLIQDWITHAILGMYELEGQVVTDAWIAEKIAQPVAEISKRTEMLLARGLLKKDAKGKVFRITASWDTRSIWTDEERIQFHRDSLRLSSKAIGHPNSNFFIQTRTFPGNVELLAFAQKEIERLFELLDAMADGEASRKELLRFSFQSMRFDFRE